MLWIAVKGSEPKNKKLGRWLALIVVVPLAIHIYLRATWGPYGMVASNFLVNPKFAGQIDNAQVWMELKRRAQSGQLSALEITAAVDSLAAAMASGRTATWKRGQPLHWASPFLQTPQVEAEAAPQSLERLLDLYHGQPRAVVTAFNFVDDKARATLSLDFGSPFGLMPSGLLWTTEFYVDGKLTPPFAGVMNGAGWSAQATVPITGKGEHEIRVDFIRTYIPSSAGNGGFTTSPVKSWNVSKDYPLKTIPVTVKVKVGE